MSKEEKQLAETEAKLKALADAQWKIADDAWDDWARLDRKWIKARNELNEAVSKSHRQ